jgi:hypothetical protein
MTHGPTMRLITISGVVAAEIDNPEDRSTIGGHANAVARFLATGDTEPLEPFRDVDVAGHRLQTDPGELEAWAAQGELEFEDIYDSGR